MKRYKLTLLVHHIKEVLAVSGKAAHEEAVRLSKLGKMEPSQHDAIIVSVEYMRDEPEQLDL